MQAEHLKLLKEFYEEDPNDPFNLYSLVLAYEKFDLDEAKNGYTKLLNDFPTYLPTYYMAGKFFENFSDQDFVLYIYKKGIELAISQSNSKAESELIRALQGFIDEMEL
jgi:tetratricopeptide (TPR) repeat protein